MASEQFNTQMEFEESNVQTEFEQSTIQTDSEKSENSQTEATEIETVEESEAETFLTALYKRLSEENAVLQAEYEKLKEEEANSMLRKSKLLSEILKLQNDHEPTPYLQRIIEHNAVLQDTMISTLDLLAKTTTTTNHMYLEWRKYAVTVHNNHADDENTMKPYDEVEAEVERLKTDTEDLKKQKEAKRQEYNAVLTRLKEQLKRSIEESNAVKLGLLELKKAHKELQPDYLNFNESIHFN